VQQNPFNSHSRRDLYTEKTYCTFIEEFEELYKIVTENITDVI